MNVSDDTQPLMSDETMFGCECALPFLTGLQGVRARKGAASMAALGVMVALAACDGTPQAASRPDAADKVSAAFDKVERQIERAKARPNKNERQASSAGQTAAPVQR